MNDVGTQEQGQSPPTDEVVADPSPDAAVAAPEASEAPTANPVDSLTQELEQLRGSLQQNEAGASRRINELTDEATQARTQAQQLSAEVDRLNRQLNQSRTRQQYDDDPYADNGAVNQPTSQAGQDALAREAIGELNNTVQTLKAELETSRSTAAATAQIMSEYDISEQDAQTAVALFNEGRQVEGASYAHKAAERERLRKEAISSARRANPPPVTGAGATGGGTTSAPEVSDSQVDDILQGNYSTNQIADMFSKNLGLLDRIKTRRTKSTT